MKNKTTKENKPAEAINCPNGVNENKAQTSVEETSDYQERNPLGPAKKPMPPTLCLNEVELMVDALNGIGEWLMIDSEGMDMFVNDACKRGCCGLVYAIEDAIASDGLDEKWEVDGSALVQKLRNMPPDGRRKLILAIGAFWERQKAEADTVMEKLRQQLNRALAPQGAASVVEAMSAPVTQN